MSLITKIQIPDFPSKIDHSKSMMFMGSCFSENMGQKLIDQKFNVDMNPFGILYNPESIGNSLRILLEKSVFTEADLFQDQGLWNSFSHHSRFSDTNPEVALEKINSRIQSSHNFLKKADFLMITLGTSWIYKLINSGQVVANCHKVSAAQFDRYRLKVNEIVDTYEALLEKLWAFNPNLKVIFTVSPIRHLKDGAIENQLSKSTLLLAIDHLISKFGDRGCYYFPSYEIMMDELRDYRFYAEDMIHLSPLAINYIFERFTKSMFTVESMEIATEVLKVRKAMEHRPVNPQTAEFRKFINSSLVQIGQLSQRLSYLDFTLEKEYFEHKMTSMTDLEGK
ncbi:MAG: GSCFA domain-containing protein [Bacteroidia bacterium]